MYTARALSAGRVKLFKRKIQISPIESYASPANQSNHSQTNYKIQIDTSSN